MSGLIETWATSPTAPATAAFRRRPERRLLEVGPVASAVRDRRQRGHDVAERDASRAELLRLGDDEQTPGRARRPPPPRPPRGSPREPDERGCPAAGAGRRSAPLRCGFTSAYWKIQPVLDAAGPTCTRTFGGSSSRQPGDAHPGSLGGRARGPPTSRRSTSTYAIPDIDEPRMAVDPGTARSASVSTRVTRVATSVAGCPIQSATSPICGSDRSGTASRESATARELARERERGARRRGRCPRGACTKPRSGRSRRHLVLVTSPRRLQAPLGVHRRRCCGDHALALAASPTGRRSRLGCRRRRPPT